MMSIFYAFLSFNDIIKSSWCQETPLNRVLTTCFQHLIASNEMLMSSNAFNTARNQLRDFLSNNEPACFPRYGPVGAPADQIFHYLKKSDNVPLSRYYHCPTCSSSISGIESND